MTSEKRIGTVLSSSPNLIIVEIAKNRFKKVWKVKFKRKRRRRTNLFHTIYKKNIFELLPINPFYN